MRVFVAIEIPADVRDLLSRLVAPLRSQAGPVRWEATAKFHVTLKFIGEQSEPRVAAIAESLRRSADNFGGPFELRYSGTGMFPDRMHPRVFWVGADDRDGRVSDLQRGIDRALEHLGLQKEERPFHPHVTVGRAPGGRAPRPLIEAWETLTFHTDAVPVHGFSLMKSELQPGASVYTVIERFPLARFPADAG